jgi:soluble lytic murein transglycosylase-like protein
VFACATIPAGAADGATSYRLQATDRSSIIVRASEPYQADKAYRLPAQEVAKVPEPQESRPQAPRPFASEIEAAASGAGIDASLVHAVVQIESAYNSSAISTKGAVGLMQVLPETALRYGVTNPSGVRENLRAGTLHLRALMDMFGNRLDLVLAAYNAGEGAVRRHNNAIPPFRETRNSGPAVLSKYQPAVQQTSPMHSPLQREYLPGTRLAPDALARLGGWQAVESGGTPP